MPEQAKVTMTGSDHGLRSYFLLYGAGGRENQVSVNHVAALVNRRAAATRRCQAKFTPRRSEPRKALQLVNAGRTHRC